VVDDNHPPFSFARAGGQADGVSVRIIAALLSDQDPPVRIEAMPWRRIVLMARTTPNLVIASVMQLPERREQFIWLGSLFHDPISLYALRSRQLLVKQPDALQSLRIGTRRDSAGYRQLVKIGVPLSQIDVVDDPLQNLRKLQTGRLDLITLQPGVLAWHARQFGIAVDSLEPVFALLPETDFQLAASPGSDPALVAALRQRLAALAKSGRLDQIRRDALQNLLP
jgi:polar amino acid transport system substrate-binding protein